MAGAFIISRDIFENAIWQNNTEFRLFFLIVGKAIFAEEGQRVGQIYLKKGQWLRSYRNLQSDLEYIENHAVKKPSLSTIKKLIDKLVRDERVTVEQTELGTLFTVCNYCKYQDFEHYKKATKNTAKNNAKNRERTESEQIANNNNNGENVDKEKTVYGEFVFLTEEEYGRLQKDFTDDLPWMIDRLNQYLGQSKKNRTRYDSHNHVLRGWVKDRLEEEKAKQPQQKKGAKIGADGSGLEFFG